MSIKIDSETKASKSSPAKSVPNTATNTEQSADENITGRGVFVIETVPAGVAVRTAFLAEDGRLLDVPAVFPSLMYALAQIEELKQLVTQRFADAAKIGNQVIAQQSEVNRVQAASDREIVAGDKSAIQVSAAPKADDDILQ